MEVWVEAKVVIWVEVLVEVLVEVSVLQEESNLVSLNRAAATQFSACGSALCLSKYANV